MLLTAAAGITRVTVVTGVNGVAEVVGVVLGGVVTVWRKCFRLTLLGVGV